MHWLALGVHFGGLADVFLGIRFYFALRGFDFGFKSGFLCLFRALFEVFFEGMMGVWLNGD